mgnify:FL=1
MYTLGIPDRQKRRTLGYLKQQWIEFEEHTAMEGFFDVSFPGMDEDAFRNIVMKLKQQGVTTIGADKELTERNIMKLTNLIKEDFSTNLDEDTFNPVVDTLKQILQKWEMKKYDSDRQRWEEYYMDIEELISDFEEQQSMKGIQIDAPRSMQEQKVRNLIRKTLRK